MTGDEKTEISGLAWPAEYAALQPVIQQEWGVDGEIYLNRKLSGGKSGALVYTADLASADFTGQAILKFDTVEDGDASEEKEFERHRKAIDNAPDYAAKHIERLVHATFKDGKVALISTITGRGVEYVAPWSSCPFDRQLTVISDLSSGILERWNQGYALSPGLRTPVSLLQSWLEHRIKPGTSRLFDFVADHCGITHDTPAFTFDGKWYPNPVAFATGARPVPDSTSLRAVTGNCHGDLHGLNVLVVARHAEAPTYSLIDLAMYRADQYLFYDHAYFEIAYLLANRGGASPEYWTDILEHLKGHEPTGLIPELRADDLGLRRLVASLRQGLYDWIDGHEPNRLAYMESQYLLARVAAGLNFANKQLDLPDRRLALLYAAFNLKAYLRHQGIDWPKYGPLLATGAETEDISGTAGTQGPAAGTVQRISPDGTGAVSADVGGDAHPPLPEHPAIAVLPFDNPGGDQDRAYIADGIALEIITELSRVDWLTVIARGSSFAYKGKDVDPVTVGRELGVHYLVEGTVRPIGDRLRVTAQLVDASDGRDIWARRYDSDTDKIFAVLDEIAESVVANIDTSLKKYQRNLAKRKRGSFSVWELSQRALALYMRRTKSDSKAAKWLLDEALKIDPTFAPALAGSAMVEIRKLGFGPPEDAADVLDQAYRFALQAVEGDEGSSLAHSVLGRVYSLRGEHEKALVEGHEAVELNPSFSLGYFQLGGSLIWAGRAADGLTAIEKSISLSPKDPLSWMKHFGLGSGRYFLGDFDAAEQSLRRAQNGHFIAPFACIFLSFVLVRQGRLDDAKKSLDEAQKLRADMSWDLIRSNFGAMVPDYWTMIVEDAGKVGLADP